MIILQSGTDKAFYVNTAKLPWNMLHGSEFFHKSQDVMTFGMLRPFSVTLYRSFIHSFITHWLFTTRKDLPTLSFELVRKGKASRKFHFFGTKLHLLQAPRSYVVHALM